MLVDMAGLPAASIVPTARIATIEAADGRRIGALPGADRVAARAQVAGTPATPLGR